MNGAYDDGGDDGGGGTGGDGDDEGCGEAGKETLGCKPVLSTILGMNDCHGDEG